MEAFVPLFEYYLQFDYAEEPVFLVSALLDANVGPVVIDALSADLRRTAVAEATQMIEARRRAAPPSTPATIVANVPAFLQPAARRQSNILSNNTDDDLNELLVAICRAAPAARAPVARAARAARAHDDDDNDEYDKRPAVAVEAEAVHVDSIHFYTDGAGAAFCQIAPLALEMFTIAAGEAACERMFSAAGYFDAKRRDFMPKTLSMLTMCKYYPTVK